MTNGCTVPDCDSPFYALDYCRFHYRKFKLYGDPLSGRRERGNKGCLIDGCPDKHQSHGYCNTHSKRFKRNGHPLKLKRNFKISREPLQIGNSMNLETVAAWLEEHPGSSSTDLRVKVGLTAKGTPISSRLPSLVDSKYATKKNCKGGNEYTLTKLGIKWINGRREFVQSLIDINKTSYNHGAVNKAVPKVPMNRTSSDAMDSIATLIDKQRRCEGLLRSIMLQCKTALGEDIGDDDE